MKLEKLSRCTPLDTMEKSINELEERTEELLSIQQRGKEIEKIKQKLKDIEKDGSCGCLSHADAHGVVVSGGGVSLRGSWSDGPVGCHYNSETTDWEIHKPLYKLLWMFLKHK